MKQTLLIMLGCMVAVQGFAGVVWSEDFSYAQGTTLTATGDPAWNGNIGNYWTGNSSNLIMRAADAAGGWTFVNNAQAAAGVATLSIDLRSDATYSGNSYLRLAMSGTAGNVALIDFNGGWNRVQTVQTGGYDHFDIIVNTSGSVQPVEYAGGTIANDTIQIWKNDAKVHEAAVDSSVSADGFGLWMNGGSDPVASPPETMYADNMVWRDSAYAIPEPATFGLLGLASLGIYTARKLRVI